jgi:hypothetical protein
MGSTVGSTVAAVGVRCCSAATHQSGCSLAPLAVTHSPLGLQLGASWRPDLLLLLLLRRRLLLPLLLPLPPPLLLPLPLLLLPLLLMPRLSPGRLRRGAGGSGWGTLCAVGLEPVPLAGGLLRALTVVREA